MSCETNSCLNGGTCIQTGRLKKKKERICIDHFFFFLLAYGGQCSCPDNYSGNICQYSKTPIKSNKNITQIENRQLDDIFSKLSLNTQERAVRLAIAMGNKSQFVFCLTNPCENGGSCFITNSATTKGICICREGYDGDYCENLNDKKPNNIHKYGGYCSSNPCLHGGTCVEVGDYNGYCRCTKDYRGGYCEVAIKGSGCNPNPW